MRLQKDIKIFDETMTVIYTKEAYSVPDSPIVIYDKYKVSIVLSDGLNAVVDKNVINSGKNSVLFFRPDELHFGRFARSGVYSYLDFLIPASAFEKFFNIGTAGLFLTDNSRDRVNYIIFDILEQKNISDIASEVINVLKSDDENKDMKLFSLILRTVLLCSDFYEEQKKHPISINVPYMVTATMQYIKENFEKKISLELLAKTANCSVTYLSRIFKQYTGMTVYEFITATRIKNAGAMLSEGSTVTEACFSSGFEDCSNFIRTFKKATGKTPLLFKKEQGIAFLHHTI